MRVIPTGEGLPLAPSMCFICEESPQQETIDTFRTFQTHLPTKLTGRKYVCVGCAYSLGALAGMVSGVELNKAIDHGMEMEEQLAEAQLRVEQLEAVHVDTLKGLLAKATQPAPTVAPKVPARKPVRTADGE